MNSSLQSRVEGWAVRFSGREWSTCEIGLSEADYTVLLEEMNALDGTWFRYPPAWLGLALTIVFAECGRREANETDFWVPVSRRFACAVWYRRCFTLRNAPTTFCRRLLEDTARRYRLRHVYGNEDTMEWFVSMRLQFGFTRRGFERRLHEWLPSSIMPMPCRLLLTDMRSDSFHKVWRHLWLFRKDKLSERQLRICLDESPWVLPEWHDALARKALERREHDYIYEAHGSGGDTDQRTPCGQNEEPDEGGFLSTPRLVWGRGTAPRFEFSVESDASAFSEFAESEYGVFADGNRVGRILRQTDGAYLAEQSIVSICDPQPSMLAELRSVSGECVADQRVDLWNEDLEVAVFDLTAGGIALTGEIQGIKLKPGNEYAALTTPDLKLEPQPNEGHDFAGKQITRFTAQADTPVVIRFEDGTEYETLDVAEREDINLDTVRAELVTGDAGIFGGLTLTARYRITVTVPNNIVVRRVRRNGGVLNGNVQEGGWKSEPIDLAEAEQAKGIRLQITVGLGNKTHTVYRIVYAPVDGAVLWEGHTDREFSRSAASVRHLNTEKHRRTLFLFRVNGDIQSHYIFEGGFCHGRVNPKPQMLKRLHGFGSQLCVGYSRFNTHTQGIACVSPAVMDTGILASDTTGGITLLHPLNITNDHQCVVIRPDWSFRLVPVEAGTTAICLNTGLLSGDWLAIGLFFKGRRLGTVWNQNPSLFVTSFANADPQKVAQNITLFKMPFLHPAFKNAMRAYLLAHPAAFLETWTDTSRETLELDGIRLAWPDVSGDDALHYSVCSLIGTGRLTLEDDMCRAVIGAFGGDADALSVQEAAILLDDVADWSPRLAARLAGVLTGIDRDELCKAIRKMPTENAKAEIAHSIGVKPQFIGRLLTRDGAGDDSWADNVARLLHNRMFRRLLTCFFISNPRI